MSKGMRTCFERHPPPTWASLPSCGTTFKMNRRVISTAGIPRKNPRLHRKPLQFTMLINPCSLQFDPPPTGSVIESKHCLLFHRSPAMWHSFGSAFHPASVSESESTLQDERPGQTAPADERAPGH
ncbi:uncharacterized protein PGTG_00183 [Puccinia graminis f. sp. tritici CRL 75-36-700-3]|uniref:Uncharacterized protein n=1 Tax=Puccinia graminis f. sp. tritici (strain CRL 75-36-700-3 / race SCCL) TaxID=418459 RepID=E3JQE8_PUCGT|nr:uncharacterized protein PGTG_00183 [Puccinia graminis f. sp. tritici CRL 75-36-700-3]EFP74227.1 hypothetical protein PGTG_00183 [Puccinia graminis f. sp. tritici CRL 75-36-700-3]